MEGSAKILSLIARDESQHLAMSQQIIKAYLTKENDKVMNKVIKDTNKEVYKIYDDAVQQEKDWASYLFSKGSMIRFSEKLLHQYVEYTANRRMRVIGLDQKYEQSSANNPLPWTQHWFNSRSLQNAPQETEIESYDNITGTEYVIELKKNIERFFQIYLNGYIYHRSYGDMELFNGKTVVYIEGYSYGSKVEAYFK